MIPFPFGYAYHDWDRDAKLFIWIPFNRFYAWWKRFEIWIRFKDWDEALQAAYRAGYRQQMKDIESFRTWIQSFNKEP